LSCFSQSQFCPAAIPDRADLNLLEFIENTKNGTLRRNWKHSGDNSVDATFYIDFAGIDLTEALQWAAAKRIEGY
jgi:hypothetical protein